MNDGFGGDTVIEQNLFFASLLETSDHGPYNSWDRLPFLTEVEFGNGTASIGLAYNKLVANMFFSGTVHFDFHSIRSPRYPACHITACSAPHRVRISTHAQAMR